MKNWVLLFAFSWSLLVPSAELSATPEETVWRHGERYWRKQLASHDKDANLKALMALRHFKQLSKFSKQGVLKALAHESLESRLYASWIVNSWRSGRREAKALLIRVLLDEGQQTRLRVIAAQALGDSRDDVGGVVKGLAKATEFRQGRLRLAALESLIELDDRGSLTMSRVIHLVKDPEAEVAVTAATALVSRAKHAKAAIPVLVSVAGSKKSVLRGSSYFGGKGWSDKLSKRAFEALKALARHFPKAVVVAVKPLLKHKDSRLRQQTLWLYGDLGAAAASEFKDICAHLADECWVSRAASRALVRLGQEGRAAVPLLAKMVVDSGRSYCAREGFASALGALAGAKELAILRAEVARLPALTKPSDQAPFEDFADFLSSQAEQESYRQELREAIVSIERRLKAGSKSRR